MFTYFSSVTFRVLFTGVCFPPVMLMFAFVMVLSVIISKTVVIGDCDALSFVLVLAVIVCVKAFAVAVVNVKLVLVVVCPV